MWDLCTVNFDKFWGVKSVLKFHMFIISDVWRIGTNSSHMWRIGTSISHTWRIGTSISHTWRFGTNFSHSSYSFVPILSKLHICFVIVWRYACGLDIVCHFFLKLKIINGRPRECHNKKAQSIPSTKRKRNLPKTETTKLHVNNSRKTSSLFPNRVSWSTTIYNK